MLSLIKVKIICKKHGIFDQTPNIHLSCKCGCPKCKGGVKYTFNDFIKKSKEIHNDKYNYSLVNYVNSQTKIKIICEIHGVFEQKANDHLNGNGCPKCYGNIKPTTEKFIKKAREIHNDKYDYSLVNYINNRIKIKIICKKHGLFEQRPDAHINQKQGCPICKESWGEKEIRNILKQNNINFESQKTFEKCVNKSLLPFDFYLPKYNLCIEYDGIQHFKPIDFFGGKKSLKETQKKDKIKTDYCKENNIELIRISYEDDISTIITSLVCHCK